MTKIRRKLVGVKRNELRKALKHKAHCLFVLNEKRNRQNRRKNEAFTNGWDELMDECIDIETPADAKSYFSDVENLAKRLDLICSDGRPFKASDAIKEWYWVEEQVEKSVQGLLDKYGDDIDDLPVIGLKYYGHDDTLAIGVYDNGDFTACVGWEFRKAMTHKLRVDGFEEMSIGKHCRDIHERLSTPHIPYVSDAEEKAAIAEVLKPHVIAICHQYDGRMIGSFSHMNDNIRFELNELVECASHYSLLGRSVIESIVHDLWKTYG